MGRLSTTALRSIVEQVDHSAHRFLQEVVSEQLAWQRRRRAEVFLACRPRPGDFLGASSVELRREQWRRCTETARALAASADLCPIDDIRADVANVLSEAAC